MEIWKPPFSNKILLNFSEWTRCPTGKKWTIQENGGEINLIRLGVVSPSSLEKHRECGKHTPPRTTHLYCQLTRMRKNGWFEWSSNFLCIYYFFLVAGQTPKCCPEPKVKHHDAGTTCPFLKIGKRRGADFCPYHLLAICACCLFGGYPQPMVRSLPGPNGSKWGMTSPVMSQWDHPNRLIWFSRIGKTIGYHGITEIQCNLQIYIHIYIY